MRQSNSRNIVFLSIILTLVASLLIMNSVKPLSNFLVPPVKVTEISHSRHLYPIADAYVSSAEGEENSNFGEETYMEISNASNTSVGEKIGYLMFDLSTIPPNTTVSNETSLTLHRLGITTTLKIGLHYSSDNLWSESTINWNNKPSYDEKYWYLNVSKTYVDERWCVWEEAAVEYVSEALDSGSDKVTFVVVCHSSHEADWVQFSLRGHWPMVKNKRFLVVGWTVEFTFPFKESIIGMLVVMVPTTLFLGVLRWRRILSGKILRILGLSIMGVVIFVGLRLYSNVFQDNPNISVLVLLLGNWGVMLSAEGIVLEKLEYISQKRKGMLFTIFARHTAPILCTIGVVSWPFIQDRVLSYTFSILGCCLIGSIVFIVSFLEQRGLNTLKI